MMDTCAINYYEEKEIKEYIDKSDIVVIAYLCYKEGSRDTVALRLKRF